MDKKILLQELADGLVRRRGLARKDAELFVRTVFDIVAQYLEADKTVKIKGLGTFKIIQVNSRESVNVNTGERFRIDGHAKITFVPDAVLKDEVNKPFIHFETVVINNDTSIEEMERLDAEGTLPVLTVNSDLENEGDETLDTGQDKFDSIREKEFHEELPADVVKDAGADSEVETQIPSDLDIVKCEQESDGEISDEVEEHVIDEQPESLEVGEDLYTEELESETNDPVDELADVSSSIPINEAETVHDDNNSIGIANQEISHLQVDYQRVEAQHVDDLNVTSQRIEHQTIENQHIVQPVKNAGGGRCLRINLWGMIGLLVLILMLMLGSYYAGYYGLLCPPCMYENMRKAPASSPVKKKSIPEKVELSTDTLKTKLSDKSRLSEKDTLIQAPVVKDSIPTKPDSRVTAGNVPKEPRKQAKQVEENGKANTSLRQLPGGKYTIVGTRGTVEVKSGQTLRGIALAEYGSKDYVAYIVVHNGIANPDRVEAGRILKLPELKLIGQ